MKKLIVILFLAAFALSVNAQRSGSTTGVPWATGYKAITITGADSITQHGTPYWVFDLGLVHKLCFFSISTGIDTLGTASTNHVYVDVLGSNDGVNYYATAATQVKCGVTVDTLFALNDVSTGVLWRYLKVQYVSKTLHVRGSKLSALTIKVAEK
jgi:hypothetical protein